MNSQSILAEVERRVAELLPGVLFERGIKLHAKKSFKQGCDCTYCTIKRQATFRIGNMPSGSLVGDWEDRQEQKKIARQRMRVVYRAKLKEALNEV